MRCTACGTETPAGMAFCGACGARLGKSCPSCAFESPEGFRFCGRCGASLESTEALPVAELAASRPPPSEEERADRRTVTVMFADLEESTALSERLDPEELRDVVRRYQEVAERVVSHFGGYVAQYLGDGILVYFGYPRAHEDDARRAVLSGLGLLEALKGLNQQLSDELGLTVSIRVGIHTGLVVAGMMGAGARHERLALGRTPNIAARLQSLAEPNTVVLSAATQRLVTDVFVLEALGRHELKGASEPVAIFRALRERDVRRFETDPALPLIGREREYGTLVEAFEQVAGERGRVVLVSGEAGIGKSRLVRAFRDRIHPDRHVLRVLSCSAYSQNSAFHPLVDLVEDLAGLRVDDPGERKLDRLEAFVASLGWDPQPATALLASLLNLPSEERYGPVELTPQRQRERLSELLTRLLLDPGEGRLAVILFEDLHWIDPSTRELIDHLVRRVATAPVFILLTARPDFVPSWDMRAHIERVSLERLADDRVEEILDRLAGDREVPQRVRRRIVERADGVPLFAEELTRTLLDSGALDEEMPETFIPATLQGSLTARLDRLATVKEVAQLGAVVGREFSFRMIRAVTDLDDEVLRQELTKLADAEILYEQGFPPDSTYVFKHALLQEAAYESLLKSRRMAHHRRIARALREQFQDVAESRPEQVAHHLTEAGETLDAVEQWLAAGRSALARSANLEAIEHLRRGLELLESLPDDARRQRLEMAIQSTFGPAWIATRGYTAPEVEQAYSRALELADRLGERTERMQILRGLGTYHQGRGDLARSLELYFRFQELADAGGRDDERAEAAYLVGTSLFFLGRFREARERLDVACDPSLSGDPRSEVRRIGQDSRATALMYSALVDWQLGYPDRSLTGCQQALSRAEEVGQPFTLAGCRAFASWIHQFRGEPEATRKHAEAALEISREQGFPFWEAWSTMALGWARVALGDSEEALESLERGLATFQAGGMRLLQTYFLSTLAEAQSRLGRTDDGLATLRQALQAVESSEERFWEAELHRLEGELRAELPEHPERDARAEEALLRALEVAREQRGRSLELRAATSLGELWSRQGRHDEARRLLAEVYEAFTEGFEAADVERARSMLDAWVA